MPLISYNIVKKLGNISCVFKKPQVGPILFTLVWSVYEQVLIAALDFGKTDLASVS